MTYITDSSKFVEKCSVFVAKCSKSVVHCSKFVENVAFLWMCSNYVGFVIYIIFPFLCYVISTFYVLKGILLVNFYHK